ncbi:MAG: hypothetical protein NC395_10210 [Prevotella sp.]|nr:hypothetical protein [Prevotella sp.]
MITNHICTVIRADENDNYFVAGRYPCMWQDKEGYQAASYGAERTSESRIYIPDINADVQKGDAVTKKEISEPITDTDVSDMLSVVTVSRYDYGGKDMRHIKAVAK